MPFKNRKDIESPLETWPGHITVPVEVSPEDFSTYWKTYRDQISEKDERYEILQAWESRFHLVKDWKISGLSSEQITADGLEMPSMKLVTWVVDELNKLIGYSVTLPNSPAPSSDEEKLSETALSK